MFMFVSFDGGSPNEGDGRNQDDSDCELGLEKEVQARRGERVPGDAEERLGDAR